MSNDSNERDIAAIVAEVRTSAIANFSASFSDPAVSNLAGERFRNALKNIKQRTGSLSPVLTLLEDLDPYVRWSAASALLQEFPERARAVLGDLAHRDDFIGLYARSVLEQ